jgi:hypothetical protein
MRLLQRGCWADARQLLVKGDCNINAQVRGELFFESEESAGCTSVAAPWHPD